jgi:hypothetical protein
VKIGGKLYMLEMVKLINVVCQKKDEGAVIDKA